MHQLYLSLGSNIQPEVNLPRAVQLLQQSGEIRRVSNAWESEAVGSAGPNFLNACVLFASPRSQPEVKQTILQPIENTLGRIRTADKYAPRTIDIDIVLFDGQLCDEKFGKQAFVIVPLAEIHPGYALPGARESILQTAARLRESVWMEARPGVLDRFNSTNPEG